MKYKKILILIDLYQEYLEKVYIENKDLVLSSYPMQEEYLNKDGFGWSGVWIDPLKNHGLEVKQSFYSNETIQKQWAVENNLSSRTNFKSILAKQIEAYEPDILLIETVRDFDNLWIKNIKNRYPYVKKIFGHLCNPFYEPADLQEYDLIFCCMEWMTKELNDFGIKTIHMPNAFNSNWVSADHKNIDRDGICFYGGFLPNQIHDNRTKLIKKIIDEGINIDIFSKPIYQSRITRLKRYIKRLPDFIKILLKNPNDFFVKTFNKFKNKFFVRAQIKSSVYYAQEIRNISLPSLYGIELFEECIQKYNVVLNVHGEISKNEMANMRVFEATGGGACLLTDAKENIGDFFQEGKEVLVYKDLDDCVKQIKWINDNPEEVKKIGLAGQQRTLNEHTYFDRSEIIIKAIKD